MLRPFVVRAAEIAAIRCAYHLYICGNRKLLVRRRVVGDERRAPGWHVVGRVADLLVRLVDRVGPSARALERSPPDRDGENHYDEHGIELYFAGRPKLGSASPTGERR
jgi:hypothetical protein